MAAALTPLMERELAELAARFGEPLVVDTEIATGFQDPIGKMDRTGEVCFVIRRPSGKILLSIKTIYPRGAHRLPTGGIKPGESILTALRRESREETGLDLDLRRFLARVSYRPIGGGPALFHTFAFLLDERGGSLGVLDPDEDIEEYIEIAPAELPRVAAGLADLTAEGRGGIGGSWRDWGRFRAVVHTAVYQALRATGEA